MTESDTPRRMREEFRAVRSRKARAFLLAYSQSGTLLAAAKLSGVARQTHAQRWMKQPAYRAAFEVAESIYCDQVEAEIIRRAITGWHEPVYGKLPGEGTGSGVIGTIVRFSDRLLALHAKSRMREKYGDHVELRAPELATVTAQLAKKVIHELHPGESKQEL